MTIHPDSLKKGSPSSYYCTQCKYRHNRGSIRYHEHWAWRAETPEVLKGRKLPKQAGYTDPHLVAGIFFIMLGVLIAGVSAGSEWMRCLDERKLEVGTFDATGNTLNEKPRELVIWHDDAREVTCYVYLQKGVSCIPDTKKATWLLKNPSGVPPQ